MAMSISNTSSPWRISEVVEDQPAPGEMIPKESDGLAFRFIRGLPDGYDLRH